MSVSIFSTDPTNLVRYFLFSVICAALYFLSTNRNVQEKMKTKLLELVDLGVDGIAYVAVKLLNHPELNQAATKLIADGISTWLRDPHAQELVNRMIASETNKKDVAREIGKQMPGIVGNFAQGVYKGFRGDTDKSN